VDEALNLEGDTGDLGGQRYLPQADTQTALHPGMQYAGAFNILLEFGLFGKLLRKPGWANRLAGANLTTIEQAPRSYRAGF
jgi:hypothetical protein